MKMARLTHLIIVLIDILKIKRIKLQLFGLEMTQKIIKKYPINNFIKKFRRLLMVLKN